MTANKNDNNNVVAKHNSMKEKRVVNRLNLGSISGIDGVQNNEEP